MSESAEQLFDHTQDVIRVMDPELEDSVCTKLICVTEWQQPDGTQSLVHVSVDAGGAGLRPWDSLGLLTATLNRILKGK